MARGITQEQIFEAAQALLSRGESVTIANVRHELGDTGSFSTIHESLRIWREGHRPDQPPAISEALDAVGGAMRKVWSAAWFAAQSALSCERESLEAARTQLETERTELLVEIERLEAELEVCTEASKAKTGGTVELVTVPVSACVEVLEIKANETLPVEPVAAPTPAPIPAPEEQQGKRTKKSS